MRKSPFYLVALLISCENYQYKLEAIDASSQQGSAGCWSNIQTNDSIKPVKFSSITRVTSSCNSKFNTDTIFITSFPDPPMYGICESLYRIDFLEPISLDQSKNYYVSLDVDYKLKFFATYFNSNDYGLYSDNININLRNEHYSIRLMGALSGHDISEDYGQTRNLCLTYKIHNIINNEKITGLDIKSVSHFRRAGNFPMNNFPKGFFADDSILKINSITLINQP